MAEIMPTIPDKAVATLSSQTGVVEDDAVTWQ
jgi:hypothetical protein